MWAFETFPSKLRYVPDVEDGSIYIVEVFGYFGFNQPASCQLIGFREIILSIGESVGRIEVLPIDEFQNRFKNYTLVQK